MSSIHFSAASEACPVPANPAWRHGEHRESRDGSVTHQGSPMDARLCGGHIPSHPILPGAFPQRIDGLGALPARPFT